MKGSTDALVCIPISALQHWSYCQRQCMLIHLDEDFADNVHTMRGQAIHERVDVPGYAMHGNRRHVRALPLYSDRLGLVGRADLVEFLADGSPFPVEFKHGPRRASKHDEIQLAAQAICLEEMTGLRARTGAIYHVSSRHRREVDFTDDLLRAVEETTALVRAALDSGSLPRPANDQRCKECSLQEICQPQVVAASDRFAQLRQQLFETYP